MELIKSIKSIFIKEQNFSLISINDIIYIPDRSFYKDDIDTIKLIDNYKDKYLKLLSQKKTLTTKELKFNDLEKDLIMNIDLLLHNLITEDNYTLLAAEEIMIQMTKFKLYLSKINEMEKETITRLIALKELQTSKKISSRNKNCLLEEINSLSNSLVIFLTQKKALTKEIDNYLNMVILKYDGIDHELLKERYDKVLFIASSLNFNTISDNKTIQIAYIEKELEIYAYKHKDEIKKIEKELLELENIKKTTTNKNHLLNRITNLEKKYLLFYEYGINIILEEQLKKLYKIKFDILTCDINYLRNSPLNINDYGYSYYQTIIMNKIEKIVKGENINFKETFKDNTKNAIKIIINSFKNEYNEFAIDELLDNKLNLNLLLSFDQANSFKEMLDDNYLLTTIDIEESTNFYEYKLLSEEHSYWADKVPLRSYLSLISSEESKTEWNIYELYKILENEYLNNIIYKIPEGIKYLNIDLIPKAILDEIRKKSKDKVLLMPSTLKTIKGNIFNDKYPNIILNEGLETIGISSLLNINLPYINIPSSVAEISKEAFNIKKLKTLNFDDYPNSKLLHNKEEFTNFIYSFISIYETGNEYNHYISDEARKKQKAYHEGSYSTVSDWELLDHDCLMYEIEYTTKIKEIVLKEKDKSITISNKEYLLKDYTSSLFRIDYIFVLELVDKIEDLIKEKTGHDIFVEKEPNKFAKTKNL